MSGTQSKQKLPLPLLMEIARIPEEISAAGSWLPFTTVRLAFCHREALTPILLDAVRQRATVASSSDIRQHRLVTFAVFYLAQQREPELFEPTL